MSFLRRPTNQLQSPHKNAPSLLTPRKERFKNSFIQLLNRAIAFPTSIRTCPSVATFRKKLLRKRFNISELNYLVYIADHYPAILHTGPCLGNTALNYDLFLRGCSPSPVCTCSAPRETRIHFLLFLPRFVTHHTVMLASVSQVQY